MRATLILGLLVASVGVPAPLPDTIQARIRDFPANVSLYAKNLETGVAVGVRESSPVRTASTIKLPIMAAVFDAVAHGQAKWTQPLTLRAVDRVSGSSILANETSDGLQLPLKEAVRLMIVVSDNTATNMILDRFTADAVNAYLDRIGIRTTRALRKVRGDGPDLRATAGFSAAGNLPGNEKYGLGVSTPRDMVAILDRLEHGELVSRDASREMIAVLKRCQDASGIRRRLSDLPVANKTGVLDALRSDVGIVYSKGGPIAMAITVDGMKVDYSPNNAGSLLIADLAKMLVDGLSR
ncbi:MAG TPA: serine hydrolase [Bryobacteraceae bacterium]|jgi:beta-lactamase class A|nr:serine hydrolase [Bryobacteraceae bacterium]